MKPFRVLCPTGHLSFTPLEKGSFLLACGYGPDAIAADAGSCDMGPRPLGADEHVSLEAWQRHDLEVMLLQSRRLGIPMIVGSASDTGTDRGVDQFVALVRDIAKEHRLPPFRLAAIYSEVPVEELKRRLLRRERIEGLCGRPDAGLSILERTDRAVAVMDAEPMRQALAAGADVIIAGRSSDCAIFAAPLLHAGHDPANSYFLGKLMECASFCAEPYMAKESVMGWIDEGAVYVRAMHPDQRCTPLSVASHAMYERPNPYFEHVAGGCVDMTDCVYEQVDDKTTRVRGARFVTSPTYRMKIEGAGFVGHRRIAIVGIRDPDTIRLIDQAVAWARDKVAERFGPDGNSYRLHYHLYGRDGIMGPMEPRPVAAPQELCVVVESVSRDPQVAFEACALGSRNLFYARLPALKGTAGAAAMMSDEILIGEPGYEWTLNHVVMVSGPGDLVRTRHHRIADGAAWGIAR
ncbi:MAG: acyclic terpene utilization AtuA family protein [Proteobacteria bacterium]|nr:acyclic terpene utilization AtuA family protein [Pseudomonadota bacterium]